ncbi:hypothetical protein K449DRAFT_439560 [Hypoxylon sp. EC38]|nr:hypothetical protein K449DRAFT_439560 [Hypoxylon sp. EC38]
MGSIKFTQENGIVAGVNQSGGRSPDEIYVEAWRSVMVQCNTRLEQPHLLEAVQIRSVDDFHEALAKLQSEHTGDHEVIAIIHNLRLSLEHYESFAQKFVDLLKNKVEVSMMWGLLSLVVRFSLSFDSVRKRVGDLLRQIGYKLEYLNEYGRSENAKENPLKEVSYLVHSELAELWLDVITVLKDVPTGSSTTKLLEDVISQFKEFINRLDLSVKRLKNHADLAASLRAQEQRELFERLQQGMSVDEAKCLPCHLLPAMKNSVFHGRESELRQIELKMVHQSSKNQTASLAIYGLGGVGKTQIALHYAWKHVAHFDAVLWFHADSESSLRSSFSDAAVRLQLHNDRGDHSNNRTRVLLWLQKTVTKWLVIYDNVESSTVLDQFWPISTQGQVLITSRKSAFAVQPANDGIEILPFTIETGRDYLLRYLRRNPEASGGTGSATMNFAAATNPQELKSAEILSQMMGGQPLALTQVASIGFKSHYNLERLLKFYQNNPRRVREKVNSELLHAGYSLYMSTVFLFSFKELSPESFTLLSIMSFCNPNGISESIFAVNSPDDLPESLDFLRDEFNVSEYIQELLDLSLINRTPDTDQFSIHCLVQSECRYHSNDKDLQKYYDLATYILCAAFPKQSDERYGPRLAQCAQHIHHVFALRDNLAGSRGRSYLIPSDDFCVLMRNASWYCVEVHLTNDLEYTTTVAMEAAKRTGFAEREPKHYAQLCNCASRLWAQRGNFVKALKFMEECRQIREKIKTDVWSAANNLGNIYMSMGDPKKALETHEECASLFPDEASAPKHALKINKLNRGRTLTVLGKFSDAKALLDEADTLNDDWLMGIHINYHRSLLLRAQGNLGLAIKGFEACIQAIEKGNHYQALLHAACLYKIGCIYYQKGDLVVARTHLQHSHDIHELRESAPCELARVKYMLSLSMASLVGKADVEKRERLYKAALKIQTDLSGGEVQPKICEDLYNRLVEGQLR